MKFNILRNIIFCFIILYKGLNNSNIYVPEAKIEKTLIKFNSIDVYSENKISSDQIFSDQMFSDHIVFDQIFSDLIFPIKFCFTGNAASKG